jgi:hypothetical protein
MLKIVFVWVACNESTGHLGTLRGMGEGTAVLVVLHFLPGLTLRPDPKQNH